MDAGGDATLPVEVTACLASARVAWSPEAMTLNGRTGRSGVVRIEEPSHVIEAEITVVRVSGIEETALADEHAYNARFQMLRLDLEPDECVESLRTRILARGCHHRQAMELLSVEPTIDRRDLLDDVQRFPIGP